MQSLGLAIAFGGLYWVGRLVYERGADVGQHVLDICDWLLTLIESWDGRPFF